MKYIRKLLYELFLSCTQSQGVTAILLYKFLCNSLHLKSRIFTPKKLISCYIKDVPCIFLFVYYSLSECLVAHMFVFMSVTCFASMDSLSFSYIYPSLGTYEHVAFVFELNFATTVGRNKCLKQIKLPI